VGQRGSANGETGCCSTSIDGVDVEGSVDSRLIQCDSAKAEEETMRLLLKWTSPTFLWEKLIVMGRLH
jgi:hypothetical protein